MPAVGGRLARASEETPTTPTTATRVAPGPARARPAKRRRKTSGALIGAAIAMSAFGAAHLWSSAARDDGWPAGGASLATASMGRPGDSARTRVLAVHSAEIPLPIGVMDSVSRAVRASLWDQPAEEEPDEPLPAARPVRDARLAEVLVGSFTHPVPSTDRPMPDKSTRRFGAWREGPRPDECGEGHCGVDLDGPRGSPIVAVRDGVVEKAVRGGEDRAGKYVRLRHDDALVTYYMHLDDIRDDLRPGDRVQAGELLGSLGRSGIHASLPHLHFGVKLVASRGERFVDPVPLLERARVIGVLDMTLGAATPAAEPDSPTVKTARIGR
jgi:murein DD-endopeptidase MepM/ murein hydrolase activator NlpD